MSLAIDRFALPADLEAEAQRIAGEFRYNDPDLMLGWLKASVAIALERPRWRNRDRDRLAVDLRVVQIVQTRPRR